MYLAHLMPRVHPQRRARSHPWSLGPSYSPVSTPLPFSDLFRPYPSSTFVPDPPNELGRADDFPT